MTKYEILWYSLAFALAFVSILFLSHETEEPKYGFKTYFHGEGHNRMAAYKAELYERQDDGTWKLVGTTEEATK